MNSARNKGRVFLLGLDGATFDVITPLVSRGELTGLSKVIQDGCHGFLRSTVPPNTAPAWVSMTTGKNPGKHGIFDFWTSPWDNYERYIINSSSVQSPRIWNLLEQNQKKSIIFNVPVTYPPSSVNGVLISGMLTPDLENEWTYPSSLKQDILTRWPDYIIDSGWNKEDTADPVKYLNRTIKALEIRRQVLEKTLENNEWDFCMAVFIALDRIQHFLWRFYDTSHPQHDPDVPAVLLQAVPEIYRKIDELVQWVLSVLREEDTLIITSDHGFGKLEYELYLYHWLVNEGFTSLNDIHPSNHLTGMNRINKTLTKFLSKRKSDSSRPGLMRKQTLDDPVHSIGQEQITWDTSKAFFGTDTDCGVYINLRGKFQSGNVNEGDEYNTLRDTIRDRLLELKNKNGERVIEKVFYKEEVYKGRFLHLAPDMIIQTIGNKGMIMESMGSDTMFAPAVWRNGH